MTKEELTTKNACPASEALTEKVELDQVDERGVVVRETFEITEHAGSADDAAYFEVNAVDNQEDQEDAEEDFFDQECEAGEFFDIDGIEELVLMQREVIAMQREKIEHLEAKLAGLMDAGVAFVTVETGEKFKLKNKVKTKDDGRIEKKLTVTDEADEE